MIMSLTLRKLLTSSRPPSRKSPPEHAVKVELQDTQLRKITFCLPIEVITFIIKVLLKDNDPAPLISLLKAYEELSGLISLITDHHDYPYKLFNAPKVQAIDLFDDDSFSMRLRPIRLFSFINHDSMLDTGHLSWFRSCTYGRYLSRDSFVMMAVRGKYALASRCICYLMGLHGIIRYTAYPLSLLSTSLEILSITDAPPIYSSGTWENGFLPHEGPVKSLTVVDRVKFGSGRRFVYLESLRLCVHDTCADWYENCKRPVFTLDTPRLRNLRIEYKSTLTPRVVDPYESFGSLLEEPAELKLTLINRRWNSDYPFGKDCLHMTMTPFPDQSEMDFVKADRELPTLKFSFMKMFLVGVSDYALSEMNFSRTKVLAWKRLCPAHRIRSIEYPVTRLFCPNLTHLKIYNRVRTNDGRFMLPFDAPNLEALELVALNGSERFWDLYDLFKYGSLKNLKKVVFAFEEGAHPSRQIKVTRSDIKPLSYSLQELTIFSGYTIENVFDYSCKHRLVFRYLEDLSLDLTCSPQRQMSHCQLSLASDVLPSLRTLTVTDDHIERPLMLVLHVPKTCETIILDTKRPMGALAINRQLMAIPLGRMEHTHRSRMLWARATDSIFAFWMFQHAPRVPVHVHEFERKWL